MPRLANVSREAGRFQRYGYQVEVFLVDVPQYGLNKFQLFAPVTVRPAAQAEQAARSGQPPKPRAAKASGRAKGFDFCREAIAWIGCQYGQIVVFARHVA